MLTIWLKRRKRKKQLASSPSLPDEISVNNKKDKLYNAVLLFLKSQNVGFKDKAEACTTGKQFLKTLVNVLWYIDGHHDKLKEFSKHHSAVAGLPAAFKTFSSF